jgi:aspartate/methionine/tyrosine aminotransferase
VRPRLIERVRGYIRRGYAIFEDWLEEHEGTLSLVPPKAAAIAFPRYHLDINSGELAQRLIQEKSVLVGAGDHFGVDNHLRISFGLPEDYLHAALDRIHDLIVELQSSP